jgi:hypothetical protein
MAFAENARQIRTLKGKTQGSLSLPAYKKDHRIPAEQDTILTCFT